MPPTTPTTDVANRIPVTRSPGHPLTYTWDNRGNLVNDSVYTCDIAGWMVQWETILSAEIMKIQSKPIASDTVPIIAPVWMLGLGVLAVSSASTFVRLAQGSMTSLAVAAWRLTLASVMLAPLALPTQFDEWHKLERREWGWLFASGLFLAIHFYTWISSLAMTSVAASAVLVATNPFFVGLISSLVLKERMTRMMILGMGISVIGAMMIGLVDSDAASHHLGGDVLALMGALTVACYMLIGRKLRARLSLLAYIFPVYSTAAGVLMLMALLTHVPLLGYPVQTWVWLILMAVFPQILGHSSFNWALKHLPATYVALAALSEPVGSTLLAWLILNEPPAWGILAGGVLILVGIGIASWNRD
ncbi:MAG: DMT family transporter [Anaerolineae bacterium]|nr:DMT family transporter [Anaerolineae bacterium]